MEQTYRSNSITLVLAMALILLVSSSCGGNEEEKAEAEPVPEAPSSPEMVEKVDEFEAGIRQMHEEEGEAAACHAVEQAEQMIFMATEVAWLHRNPGTELRPVYQKAVADGTPMKDVFDLASGEAALPKRYAEWDTHDRQMAELRNEMATTVSGEQCVRSLDEICEISETNPHGFALVSDTLEDLSAEMRCGG